MAVFQAKALLLICLLAGHEASRMVQQGSMAMNGQVGIPSADEEAFQKANDQCQCPANRAKFFSIQAGVLSAKSKKVAENCKGSSLLTMTFNRKCTRRMKHMMRAMKFMSKAQDDELVKSLAPEERMREQALFNTSLTNMAGALGDDGFYVLMLQKKMSANKAAVKRDPKGTVSNAVDILSKLLKGSEEEKAAARKAITDMSEQGETLSVEEEADLDAKNSQVAEGMRSEESEVQALIDDVDYFVPDNDTDTGGSLIQTGRTLASIEDLGDALAYVLVVLLVLAAVVWFVAEIMVALLSWALVALLGCGVGTAGYNALSSNVSTESWEWRTTKCFGRVFAFPFVATGRAVTGFFNMLHDPNYFRDRAERQQAQRARLQARTTG